MDAPGTLPHTMPQTPTLVKHVKGSRMKYDAHMLKDKQAKQESDIDVQKYVLDKDIKDLKRKSKQ